MSSQLQHVTAIADHRPRTGEVVTLESGDRALVTRGMEPQPGWKRPPIVCRGVYEGVEGSYPLLISVRIQGWRG